MPYNSKGQYVRWGPWLRWKRDKAVNLYGEKLLRLLAKLFYAQSKVGTAPVPDRSQFPFLQSFEDDWQAIEAEVREILKHREAVPLFHEVSPEQAAISTGQNWRTFILYGFGERLEKNCARAPVTARLLSQVPDIQTAWFSIMAPGYKIPPHRGVTTGILRTHLGLVVPKDRENCTMTVGDEVCVWEPGKAFVFDDTYKHHVWNNTDEERVILIFDFNRPMGLLGRVVNNLVIWIVKQTAFFKEPKRRMQTWEQRFEDAVRAADDTVEKLSGQG